MAVHVSFPARYEQRAPAQDVAVLTQCYESVRPETIVDFPSRHDRHRGSLRSFEGRYEKVWTDPVCVIVCLLDIDYSSGKSSTLDQRYEVVQNYLGGSETWHGSHNVDFVIGTAVCLRQTFEVVQDYLGGSETWLCSHDVDFALGQAVCLWQTFEVVQDYLGGSETWLCSHDVDFALGQAVCLWQTFEVVQDYLGRSETWYGSHNVDFALGKAVCLWQRFEIIQSYVGGLEAWPSNYESAFSSGRSIPLFQRFNVIQPYLGGSEIWSFRRDVQIPSVAGQLFSLGEEGTILAGRGVAIKSGYDIVQSALGGTVFACDFVAADRVFGAVSLFDGLRNYDALFPAATTGVMIDALGGELRSVAVLSTFDVPENRSFHLPGRYDFTENASVRLPCSYAVGNAGRFLLRLQEEAYYEYTACLTNLHTGLVTTVTTTDLGESVKSLEEHCVGDAEWEMEYETTVRFYSPDRPNQARDPVRWRFTTRNEKHWKQEPVVSELRAVKLPSFLELHFTADRPYRALESRIDAFQFRPTEEGDFFDLGVWISDSVEIDTEAPPVLSLSYSNAIKEYAVHVPRTTSTKFVGIAPIRKFPYEEVGALAEIFIP